MGSPSFRLREITFEGQRERSGDLTWAQQGIRASIDWLGEDSYYFNIPVLLPVPPECTEDDVAAALASVIRRHEVLRTRFTRRDGKLAQEVSGSGTLALRIIDSDEFRSQDAAEIALLSLWSVPFDHEHDWPLRCALATAGGHPTFLLAVVSHQAIDGAGRAVFIQQVESALAARVSPAAAVDGGGPGEDRGAWQPLDQLAEERGRRGDRATSRAAAHWRGELAKVPAQLFPPPGQPAEPRIWRIGLTSQALAAAVCEVCRGLATTPPAVMMAATAALLGAFTGHSHVPLQLIVGNRFDARSQNSMSVMAQDGIAVMEVGGAAFGDIVLRAKGASLRAYYGGHYAPAVIAGVRAEAARERGVPRLDVSAYFNDVPMPGDWQATVRAGVGEPEVVAMAAQSKEEDISSWPRQDSTLFIHSLYMPGASVLHAVTDTAVVPLATARAFLRGMERLVIRAAFHDVGPAEIAAIGKLVADGDARPLQ